MIKVPSRGTVEERLRLLEFSVNYSPVILAFPCPDMTVPAAGSVGTGALAVDRSIFRKLLPDARWVVYAAGMVNPGDANTATITLVYTTNAAANVVLGSTTATGAALIKKSLGPFDVFGTGGVPAGETIPVVRLLLQKNAGVSGQFVSWTIWLELLANKQ